MRLLMSALRCWYMNGKRIWLQTTSGAWDEMLQDINESVLEGQSQQQDYQGKR